MIKTTDKVKAKEAYEVWYDIWGHMGSLSGQITMLPEGERKQNLRKKLEELSRAIHLYSQLSED